MVRNDRLASAENWPGGDPREHGAPAAPRVGADLAVARERIGAAIEEMAARLRIRAAYLRALENGRIGDLPGSAYAVAFIRSYGQALGLDPDELVRRFKAEAASVVGRKTELAFPAPLPRRGLPASAMIMLGLVLVIGAYAGWYKLSSDGRLPPERVEPVPARLASLADQPLMPQTSPAPAHIVTADATPTVKPAPAAPPAAVPDQGSTLSPGSAAAATPPQASAAQTGSGQADNSGAIDPATRFAVHASADAWVQVRTQSGSVLFSRLMHAGDTWAVPDRAGLLLTTGNAGGTELIKDGVASQPLGGAGIVRRDLPLDPNSIGTLVQAAASR